MLGLFDYLLWLLGFCAEVYVLVRALVRGDFLRYFTLNIYLLANALVDAGLYAEIRLHGFTSVQYRFYYYFSDTLLSILMYLAIIGFYQHVFQGFRAARFVRVLATVILAGVAAISFFAIWKTENDLTGRFVVELSRNLYFVGVALTYLLWIAMVKIREARLRIIQLVLSLGVFFSASAAVYGLRYLFPNHAILKAIPPLLGCWLPISWAYTFSRVPEEAQVAPARLATLYR